METSLFSRYTAPSVLILPDLSLKDLVSLDSLWGEYDAESLSGLDKKKTKYTKLSKKFFGLDKWVMECNLECCSCHFNYNTIPISMPTRIIKNEEGDIGFSVDYNYCSFPCCMSAISKITDTHMREYRLEMLKLMFRYFFGIELAKKTIECAPGPEDREDHGGSLSKHDFKKKINKLTLYLIDESKTLIIDSKSYILNVDD